MHVVGRTTILATISNIHSTPPEVFHSGLDDRAEKGFPITYISPTRVLLCVTLLVTKVIIRPATKAHLD